MKRKVTTNSKTTIYTNKILQKLKLFILAMIIAFPTLAMSKGEDGKTEPVTNNRSEVNYKQRHSSLVLRNGTDNLYADGIKIKRDLSLIKEMQLERMLSESEIPAEDLYEGMWRTDYLNVYQSITNIPDSFMVNLNNFTYPIKEGHVTSNYGKRGRKMHYGIDLKVQTGDTIYATFEGKIRIKRYEKRGYGNYVAIRHPNGLETVYGHLSKFLVSENDIVKSGDPIALGGNTGRSTGSHLHLEFRFLGKPINPKDIVDFDNNVCHRDEFLVMTNKLDYVRQTNKYTNRKLTYHRVKKGDTLSAIALQYGTTVSAIRKANNLSSKNSTLRIGTALRI